MWRAFSARIELLRNSGRAAEAKAEVRRALTFDERLAREDTGAARSPGDSAWFLVRLGALQRMDGQPAAAVVALRRATDMLAGLRRLTPAQLYTLACAHASLADLAREPAPGLAASVAENEADEAMGQLDRAVAAGFRDLATLAIDPDLAGLRGLARLRPTDDGPGDAG